MAADWSTHIGGPIDVELEVGAEQLVRGHVAVHPVEDLDGAKNVHRWKRDLWNVQMVDGHDLVSGVQGAEVAGVAPVLAQLLGLVADQDVMAQHGGVLCDRRWNSAMKRKKGKGDRQGQSETDDFNAYAS